MWIERGMTSKIEFGGIEGVEPSPGKGWLMVGENDEYVEIRFVGHLDTEGGIASAQVVADRLRHRRIRLVLDVRDMLGYERGARIAWQEVLWPMRHRIRAMTLVGGNSVVRMGASVMTMFLGCPLERMEPDAPRSWPRSPDSITDGHSADLR